MQPGELESDVLAVKTSAGYCNGADLFPFSFERENDTYCWLGFIRATHLLFLHLVHIDRHPYHLYISSIAPPVDLRKTPCLAILYEIRLLELLSLPALIAPNPKALLSNWPPFAFTHLSIS